MYSCATMETIIYLICSSMDKIIGIEWGDMALE